MAGRKVELLIAVLNGAVGDHLQNSGNGLATQLALVIDGQPVRLERQALAAALPNGGARLSVLVHGLMSTEDVWRFADGSDYGSRLAADLGYTPLYLRYNTGRHISENGHDLDQFLNRLWMEYPRPIEELLLIGHSMGGLVARSACHVAAAHERPWLAATRRAFYVGTPHFGAPLERLGNAVSWALGAINNPYTRLIADISNVRSSGIKDLRYGNLIHDDWQSHDANALLQNRRHPVPLLPHIRHHLLAGHLTGDERLALLFGDALVPLASATGRQRDARHGPLPSEHVRIFAKVHHLGLAHHPEVYAQIRDWCQAE